ILVGAGLLERRGIEGGRPGAFVLALTEEGAAVMRAERRPLLALPGGESPQPVRPRPKGRGALRAVAPENATGGRSPDADLLRRLKAWRAAEARRRGVPAYVVFHDSTLEALAVVRPCDRGSLLRVRGVGPAKVETYGQDLLKVLAGPASE